MELNFILIIMSFLLIPLIIGSIIVMAILFNIYLSNKDKSTLTIEYHVKVHSDNPDKVGKLEEVIKVMLNIEAIFTISLIVFLTSLLSLIFIIILT